MKKLFAPLILIALLAIIIIQLGKNKEVSENRIYNYDKEKSILVTTKTIKSSSIDTDASFTGIFNANMETKINADVQGKILRYYIQEGDHVKKGQKLVKLDDELLQLQLKSIQVQIDGLQADEKRFIVLAEADAIQAVQLEKIQNGLKSAHIQRKTILEKINKTTIRAPFSGIVTAKMSEIGSFAAPGVPLLILSDLAHLKFRINVSEVNLPLFSLNETYILHADAYPNLELSAVATQIGSKGNMGNSFPVEFTIQNTKEQHIKSNMFGKISVNAHSNSDGVVIPSDCIVGSDLSPQVYIVKNKKATLHPIKISRRLQNNVIVESGLNENDIIITSGFINLFDGANIEVIKK